MLLDSNGEPVEQPKTAAQKLGWTTKPGEIILIDGEMTIEDPCPHGSELLKERERL